MKDFLLGLLLILFTLAVVVAGYYIGIALAIISAVLIGIGIVGFIVFVVGFCIYDQYMTWKEGPPGPPE